MTKFTAIEDDVVNYYLFQNDETKGPYTLGQLRSMWHAGQITGETHFCPVGGNGWLKLKVIAAQLENETELPSPQPKPLPQPDADKANRARGKKSWLQFLYSRVRSYPKTWVASVLAMVAVIALLADPNLIARFTHRGRTSERPVVNPVPQRSPEFLKRMDDFVREVARMEALTKVGTSKDDFQHQLGTTNGAFLLLEPEWPADFEFDALVDFTLAIRGWKLVSQLWSQNSGSYSYNSSLNEKLKTYAPDEIMIWKDDDGKLTLFPWEQNLRIVMGVATRHSAAGRSRLRGAVLAKPGAVTTGSPLGR